MLTFFNEHREDDYQVTIQEIDDEGFFTGSVLIATERTGKSGGLIISDRVLIAPDGTVLHIK